MERTLEPEVMDTPEEASAYDAMDHRAVNEAFVDRLLSLGARGRMLDLGTVPGHIPIRVCARCEAGTVIGIDLAQSMLAHAEEHRRASGHDDRLEFRVGDAKALEFPDGSFDVVFSNTTLHHIADPRPVLREARRVLRPGGVLLLRDLYRPPTTQRVDELVALHAGPASSEQRALFRASLCAALTPGELRVLADQSGLSDAVLVIDTDRHMSLQIGVTLRVATSRGHYASRP
jgi:ubiquinone/menaquinone biosynthesis C-methylase UbiE